MVLGALLAASCSGPTTNPGPSVPPTTTPGAIVSSESSPVGAVLATGTGYTLYAFAPDSAGHSTCITQICVTLWPPLQAHGPVTVGPGVKSALIGTIRRSDGSSQVTYGGHPLYTWRADTKPGWITGQALLNAGGYWYVVGTAGREITTPFRVGGSNSPSGTAG